MVGRVRVLGMMIDTHFGFSAQVAGALQRAGVRSGAMARLSGCTWGLDARLMRTTHAVLLTSLATYALAVVGSGAYAREFSRIWTLDNNASARRITGIIRSARLETS